MGDRKKESSGNFLTNMFGGGSKKDTKVSSSTGRRLEQQSAEKAAMLDKPGYAFADRESNVPRTVMAHSTVEKLYQNLQMVK